MSRSKKDILETEAMLQRLAALLGDHLSPNYDPPTAEAGQRQRIDAEALHRISITLQRWHELECGDGDSHGSWAIERDDNGDGPPFMVHHHYAHGRGKDSVSRTRIPDREAGAKKRLQAILKRYPGLTAYVQTDPRGCALYILKPGDVPEGEDVSAYYSRGLAVHR